ncbi:unnamed protein product, partial [Ectocarpus sp. 12 AP-2014]
DNFTGGLLVASVSECDSSAFGDEDSGRSGGEESEGSDTTDDEDDAEDELNGSGRHGTLYDARPRVRSVVSQQYMELENTFASDVTMGGSPAHSSLVQRMAVARKLRSGSKVAPTEGRQSMMLHRATSARNFDQMSQLSHREDDDEDDDSSSTDLGEDSARTKDSGTASGGGVDDVGMSAVGDADELTNEATGSSNGSQSVQDANPPNVLAGDAASGSIHPRRASAAGQVPEERPRSPPSLSLLPHQVSGDASTDNGGSRGGDSGVGDNVPVSRERRRITAESPGSDPESGFRNTPGPLD